MTKQVITAHPDGTLSGLERKKNQGIDIKYFGPATVERVSHIVWFERKYGRGWMIEFLQGPRKGKFLTWNDVPNAAVLTAQSVTVDPPYPYATGAKPDSPEWDALMLFADYDEAVRVEIAILDADRVEGRLP